MSRSYLGIVYGVSIVLHAGLAAAVTNIEPPAIVERIRVTMREVEVPPPPPTPATPPPPPPEPVAAPEAPTPTPSSTPPPPAPRRAAAPDAPATPPPAAPPAPAAAPLDFGVAMQGSVGGGGVAVPVGTSTGQPGAAPVTRTASRTLEAAPESVAAREQGCAEPATRPRPIEMPQPAYTDEARAAAIEGRVRVQIEVDAAGAVVSVRVVEGLGHGLDEAAEAAVRGARFEPATRCGESVGATFNVSVRFTL